MIQFSASDDAAGFRRAALFDTQAQRVARGAVLRLGARERTVSATIVAARFVETLRTALANGDAKLLCAWVDRACERYAGVVPVGAVVEAAFGEALREGADPALMYLRSEVTQVLARPRLVKAVARHEAVDEIDVVLDGLLSDLDQKDVLTAEHSRAVSSWCVRLGKRMGMSKSEIVYLSRSGLVHDIGKVMTPPGILAAPRRLDDEEMAIMRRHAEEGAAIVARIPLIADLVPPVRNHHERIDGHGYPDGLRGAAIPTAARIVAVADAFNAMIGRRPYRPPLAPSIALERLVESRGDQFDPEVVDAMVGVVTGSP